MLNDFCLNSTTLNGTSVHVNFADLQAQISVAAGAFIDEFSEISVAQASFVDISAAITVADGAFTDSGVGSITVSDYKWLTSTLKTAQQQFALRPYFTARVIDDAVVPSTIFTAPGQPLQGSVVTAPDGSLLATGTYPYLGGTAVGFWKITDGSNLASWTAAPTVQLAAGVTAAAISNVAITVSDYLNGTYQIEIAYFQNTGSFLIPVWWVSKDGGVTWAESIAPNVTTVAYPINVHSHIALGKPILNADNTVRSTIFYLGPGSGTSAYTQNTVCYQTAVTGNASFGAETAWSGPANTGDWTLHSLDTFYSDGYYYVVFSGIHHILESVNGGANSSNYSIYITALMNTPTSVAGTDRWMTPRGILTAVSASGTNLNSYTNPKINVDGTTVYLLFKAVTTTAITNSAGISLSTSTTTNYFLVTSQNNIDYTYPLPIVFTDGTSFVGDAGNNDYNYCPQGSNFFVAGNGQLWKFSTNNATADVTSDLLQYSVSESAGNPSSINIQVGNQNGQWYGASPTQPGASAIAKNKKVVLYQGYYNALGVPEVAPRNIYYVDDINVNVSTTNNDLTIQGRDLWKKLITLTSNFAFVFMGAQTYNDQFDGSTVTDWNQVSGSWQESGGTISPISQTASEQVITYASVNTASEKSDMAIVPVWPDPTSANNDTLNIYAFYQDSNNWLRFSVFPLPGSPTAGRYAWNIEQTIGGTYTLLNGNGNDATWNWSSSNPRFAVIVKKFNYYQYSFLVAQNTTGQSGNNLATWDSSFAKVLTGGAGGSNGVYDLTAYFKNGTLTSGSMGFGVSGTSWTVAPAFSYFKYLKYGHSQSIAELIQTIGTKASVFDYKTQEAFSDYFFTPTNYNGTFTTPNRQMVIAPSNLAIKNDVTVNDGEIEFTAKVTPTSTASDYSFRCAFRSSSASNLNNTYEFRMVRTQGNALTMAEFRINVSGTSYVMAASSPYEYAGAANTINLNIDLTQWHTYKIVFSQGDMQAFVDGEMVLGWVDNNINTNYASGYIGFVADSNTTLTVGSIVSSTFYNQIETFALNPGDELDQSLLSLTGTVKGWNFSDVLGNLKTILLSSSDPSTYTYDSQIYDQVVDNSDKEYYNQVTVYGLGVVATAQDLASIGTNAQVRNLVVTDYKITTYRDALSRATAELIDANKYNNQYNPKQPNNVGSEIFDVVTVVNTGANSSNVNQVVRVYGQTITSGGGTSSVEYSIEIETGTV